MYISNSGNIGMATLLQQNKNCMKTIPNNVGLVGATTAGGTAVTTGTPVTLSGNNIVLQQQHTQNATLVLTNGAGGTGNIITYQQYQQILQQQQVNQVTANAVAASSGGGNATRLLMSNEVVSLPVGSIVQTSNGNITVISTNNATSSLSKCGGASTFVGASSFQEKFQQQIAASTNQNLTISAITPTSQQQQQQQHQQQQQQQAAIATSAALQGVLQQHGGTIKVVAATSAPSNATTTRYFSQFSQPPQQQQQQQQQQLLQQPANNSTKFNHVAKGSPIIVANASTGQGRTTHVVINRSNNTLIASSNARRVQTTNVMKKTVITATPASSQQQNLHQHQQNQQQSSQAVTAQTNACNSNGTNSTNNSIGINSFSSTTTTTTTNTSFNSAFEKHTLQRIQPSTPRYGLSTLQQIKQEQQLKATSSSVMMNGGTTATATTAPSQIRSVNVTHTTIATSGMPLTNGRVDPAASADQAAIAASNKPQLNNGKSSAHMDAAHNTTDTIATATTTTANNTATSSSVAAATTPTSSSGHSGAAATAATASSASAGSNVAGADDAEDDEAQPEVDITINNVVCSFSVRCHLNLREIALKASNVEYRRENGMVTMKLRRPYTTASIWSSGRITCTGATSEEQSKIAARRYARILQNLGFRIRFHNFRVVNVLGTCSMPWAIKIVNFSEKYKKEASYEPELHPGVTYKMEYPDATLKIFSTGSITVTAASVASVQAAIENIYSLVYEFRKERSPEEAAQFRLKHAKLSAMDTVEDEASTKRGNTLKRRASGSAAATGTSASGSASAISGSVGTAAEKRYRKRSRFSTDDDSDACEQEDEQDIDNPHSIEDEIIMYSALDDLIEGPDDEEFDDL